MSKPYGINNVHAAFLVITPFSQILRFQAGHSWKRGEVAFKCNLHCFSHSDRFQGGNVFGNVRKRVSRFHPPLGWETETETVPEKRIPNEQA